MSERADLVFFHKARQKVLFSRLSGGQEAVDAPESEAATGSLSRLPLICFGEIAQRPSCLSPSFPDLFRTSEPPVSLCSTAAAEAQMWIGKENLFRRVWSTLNTTYISPSLFLLGDIDPPPLIFPESPESSGLVGLHIGL